MRVWLSYSLSDFLLFTPHTYYRLFELYNRAIWPVHVAAAALGLMLLVLMFYGGARRGRAIAGVLAACWLWVALAFLFARYDTVNWMARYAAAGFTLEAILLIVSGVVLNRLKPRHGSSERGFYESCRHGHRHFRIVHSALVGAAGRPPLDSDGALRPCARSDGRGHPRRALEHAARALDLFVIPLLWCAITGATLWAMDARDALLMPAIAVLAVWCSALRRPAFERWFMSRQMQRI